MAAGMCPLVSLRSSSAPLELDNGDQGQINPGPNGRLWVGNVEGTNTGLGSGSAFCPSAGALGVAVARGRDLGSWALKGFLSDTRQ